MIRRRREWREVEEGGRRRWREVENTVPHTFHSFLLLLVLRSSRHISVCREKEEESPDSQ